MKVQSWTEKYQKPPKTEVKMTKKAKVTFFRPTVLLDHAASRLVKKAENIELDLVGIILASSSSYVAVVISDNKLLVGFEGHSVCS